MAVTSSLSNQSLAQELTQRAKTEKQRKQPKTKKQGRGLTKFSPNRLDFQFAS
jgi:hypothetical protein